VLYHLPLANPQYGSPNAASSSSAPSATARYRSKHPHIAVGQNGLTFRPDSVTATVGELVLFEFYPQNHTVTESAFDKPCEPLSDKGLFQ
jgi:plastocyanin